MGAKDKALALAFAARLRELREAAGLTLAEVAGQCRPPMHAQAIARYEAGDRLPTLAVLYRLAEVYGVTPCDVLPPLAVKKKKGK
ncbi:MAG TPA: helix-turn-helix transcriptional regulator [Urbifossiella sp.]|nr:helix-turn-helix transcriptional regulator [Urbifossiella sp.]